MTGDNHLGDALAVVDNEILAAEIDKNNAYFATVVGVDGAGRIEDCDTLFQSQSTAGTHLSLVACGQLHEEARLHQSALKGFESDWTVGQESPEIETRRLGSLILRQRMVGGVDNLDLHGVGTYNS